jgi:hypothetical protein
VRPDGNGIEEVVGDKAYRSSQSLDPADTEARVRLRNLRLVVT